jgi:hypothetical protein
VNTLLQYGFIDRIDGLFSFHFLLRAAENSHESFVPTADTCFSPLKMEFFTSRVTMRLSPATGSFDG